MDQVFLTLEMSQLPIGWLKDLADQNIAYMFVACDTFHCEMSALKLG